ncbi:MAG: nucleoside-triphosphatase [Promethearchaeota archaeon]
MNILLTGEVRVGKTTVCLRLVDILREYGINPKGILTPAIYNSEGKKIGFNVLNITNNQSWLLAHTIQNLDGPRIGSYLFDQMALDCAIKVLETAFQSKNAIIFLDEIGPLELKLNEGFAPILESIPFHRTGHILIVVRYHILNEFRQKFKDIDFIVFNVNLVNRDQIPRQIIYQLSI